MQSGTKECHSLFLTVFFAIVCFGQDFANDHFFNPPVLYANGTFMELKSGSKLELVCEGQYPLLWKIHSSDVDHDIRLIEVSSVNISQPINKYKSILILEGLNFQDTGFYSCYYEETRNFESADNVTSIYVFVNDKEHLFVNVSLFDTDLLIPVLMNTRIVIPCLPTSSTVNVTLWKTDRVTFDSDDGVSSYSTECPEEYHLVTLGTDATFDPTRGFNISTRKFGWFKRFQCRANLDDAYEEINVTMKFLPDTGQYRYSPKILMNTQRDIVVNGSFTLSCSVGVTDSGTLLYADWIYPGKYKKSSLKFYPTEKWSFQMENNLTVTQAQTSDSGTYICSVTDFWNRTGKAEIKIPVYNLAEDAFSPPILLNVKTPFFVLTFMSSVQEIICVGKYPVLWKKKDAEVDLNDTRHVVLPSVDPSQPINKYKSKLTLQYLWYSDSGVYSCYYEGTNDFDSADNVTSLDVLVNNPKRYLIQPVIDISLASRATVGDIFVLKCSVSDAYLNDETAWTSSNLKWTTPSKNDIVMWLPTTNRPKDNDNSRILVERNYYHWKTEESYLIVREARTSDSGIYACTHIIWRKEIKLPVYCSANDNLISPPLLNVNETFIDLESNSTLEIVCLGMYRVLWKTGNAEITMNDSRLIVRSSVNKKGVPINEYKSTLILHDLSFKDTGFYSCYYEGTKDFKCADNVTSVYVFVNDNRHLFVEQSLIDGLSVVPVPIVMPIIIPCLPTSSRAKVTLWVKKAEEDTDRNCSLTQLEDDPFFKYFGSSQEYKLMPSIKSTTDKVINYVYYDPTSGFTIFSQTCLNRWNFQCRAHLEDVYEEINVTLKVMPDDTDYYLRPLIDMSEAQDAVVNGTFILKCMVKVKKRDPQYYPDWTYPNKLEEGSRITKKSESSNLCTLDDYRLVTSLIVTEARFSDSGPYMCSVAGPSVVTRSAEVNITVSKIKVPFFKKSNMNGTFIQVITGSIHEFLCYAYALPLPTVIWKKDGLILDATNRLGVELTDRNQKLKIRYVTKKHAGFYECIVMNPGGHIAANATLEILKEKADAEDPINGTAVIIGAVALILGISFSFCCCRLVLSYKKKRELKAELVIIAENIVNSDRNNIFNPNLPVEDQIDLLPYNNAVEFPKERLKLGKILGQGMFGRVLKAEAEGLVEGEALSTVAVKMLKEGAGKEEWKALIAEMKILIHIGKHLNIVNLLGAVTKDISKGELYVIVEFCCYGNLRHFLLKHKSTFVDQLDHRTGKLDRKVSSLPGSTFSNTLQSLHYADIAHDQVASDSVLINPSFSEQDIQNSTPMPTVRCDADSSKSNTGKNRFITTSDLLSFAFQCARGMQYLESRKIVHRDLAARNVLLAKDDIVKICDFGLAKDCYKYSKYIKTTDGLLPIKWMAIESIMDNVFTSKTDVWSFGVFLWEMFNLGGSPYPGVEINQEFFEQLIRGYRMEKPDLAPDLIYNLMKSCWLEDPNERPDFNYIAEDIGTLLESGVQEHYIKLNEPYQLMNRDLPINGYLNMSGPAQEEYTQMVDSSAEHQNRDNLVPAIPYENVASPVANGPVRRIHMIQLETFSEQMRKPSKKEKVIEKKSEKLAEYEGPIDAGTSYLSMDNT